MDVYQYSDIFLLFYCRVVSSSVKFYCLVPELISDSNNYITHMVPVLVTLDDRSFSPSPSEFTYIINPVLTSYTPWASIAR